MSSRSDNERAARAYAMTLGRRYGPAIAFFCGIALIIALVPSNAERLDRTVGDTSGASSVSGADDVAPGALPVDGVSAGTGEVSSGGDVTGAAPPATGAAVPSGGAAAPGAPAGIARSGVRCVAGARQVTWSKYAPACVPMWTGNNGGATAHGVTATTITLAYRRSDAAQSAIIDAAIPGLVPPDDEYVRDLNTYASLFNRTFELYGRKVVLKPFDGQGDWLFEHQGQDLAGAQADAATEREMGAFGDVTQAIAVSIAYSNSLAQEKVISFANIGAAQSHYAHGSPYIYNLIPTAEDEGGWASGLVCQRMWQMPAKFAGDADYRKTKRVLGLVGGDGPNYVAVGNTAEARMKKACGATVKKRVNYTIDISTYQQQAPSIIAQMKTAGVTTVMCLPCDYVMLQALYNQADGQQYYPEWVILNAGVAGALVLSQRQMANTLATDDFYFTSGVQRDKSEAYRAFKIASPKSEPAEYGYSQPYYALLRVFSAIQKAGPNLTPATLQHAWFSLPTSEAGGDAGTWLSGRNRFAPKVNSAVGLWNPDGTSYYDGEKGAYTFCDGGKQYSFTDEKAWGARRQLTC